MADEYWKPTAKEVASLLRARTKTRAGGEVGEFTEPDDPRGATRPSKAQVEELIVDAMGEISIEAHPCEDKPVIAASAKGLARLLAAMLVETSFFPEQVAKDLSPYDKFKELYDEKLPKYTEAVSEHCVGGGVGPRGYFGDYRPIGMDTVM